MEVNLSRDEISVDTIKQYYVSVANDQKLDLLVLLLKRDRPRQCIVFTCAISAVPTRLADRLAQGGQRGFGDSRRPCTIDARPRDAGISERLNFRAW